jgi:hypothetical protein
MSIFSFSFPIYFNIKVIKLFEALVYLSEIITNLSIIIHYLHDIYLKYKKLNLSVSLFRLKDSFASFS